MATDELLRKLLGKLDEIDKRTQKLVNSTESRFDAWDKILIKVKDSDEVYDPGIDLGYFTGLGSIDDFVEWVTQVDKISAYTGWTEMRIFKIAALKLTKKAGLWFDNLNTKRVRSGKEKIMTWTSLKKKLRAKYIPLHYKFECIMKMTSLSQGTISVSEYTSEFYRLRLICDLEETETIKIGRFIRGLNLPIYQKVKSSPYISFNDVCNLALEFESFQHDEKMKSSLHEFTLSEETKEEDFVSVENVADLVADYHVLHVATRSSLDEKDEPVTKEAMVEKHEERQSLDDKFLVVEENQIDTSLKLVCRDMVEEKKVLEDMFQTKEVVYKENNIIIVKHNDFLGVENLLNSPISSNYLILSSLLPKILLMELKFKAFKFYEKSPRYVLILKYFRTRGRVFFKGEENDEDQGMNMLIWIWLCVLVVMFNWRGCKHSSNVLKAGKGSGSSFVWKSIWTLKKELCNGFRWVLGNGKDIVATKDPWLRKKSDFRVENNAVYDGRDEIVSSLFIPNEKQWNVRLIRDRFVKEDAAVILAVPIPRREVMDRVAWTDSPDGIYSAKSGYRFWYNLKFETNAVPQSVGWKKVWHLRIPNKIKVFIWKFLRNVVPTRKRLSERGIRIGITCPMCLSDIEHMTHLFFECEFARGCWEHANLVYDWSEVEYAHDWLLSKVSSAPMEEVSKICVVLWGVWHWRNKKVWDAKLVSSAFAMDSSFSIQREWLEAKGSQVVVSSHTSRVKHQEVHKWKCPDASTIKINVDAPVFQNAQSFTMGMVMRNYLGEFLAGKNLCLPMADSVFKAEALGVREALSWIKDQQLHGTKVLVESDSLLTTKAIEGDKVICLEVGEVIEECKQALHNLSTVSVYFIRKNANRVAHEIARIPCLVNSQNIFTSPPTCLLEPLMFDLLS
ncbi:hypothetical protein AgCh_014632 [Apium graveolens]